MKRVIDPKYKNCIYPVPGLPTGPGPGPDRRRCVPSEWQWAPRFAIEKTMKRTYSLTAFVHGLVHQNMLVCVGRTSDRARAQQGQRAGRCVNTGRTGHSGLRWWADPSE